MQSLRRIANSIGQRVVYPLLPPTWRLPYLYWKSIWDGSCEPELRHLRSYCHAGETAVDVGANCGLYTYALSKLFRRVYAFEINSTLTGDLRGYPATEIELVHCGLSSTKAQTKLYIPVSNGFLLGGWGSLDPKNLPNASALIEMSVTVKPLDEYGLEDVSFMKIDVEGHEPQVLDGSSNTIDRCRPTVLLEVKDKNKDEINSFFLARRYSGFTLLELIHIPGSPENLIFIPNEKKTAKPARQS